MHEIEQNSKFEILESVFQNKIVGKGKKSNCSNTEKFIEKVERKYTNRDNANTQVQ